MAVVLEALAEEGVLKPHVFGDKYMIEGKLKFSGNYAANGEAGLLAEIEAVLKQLGMNAIDWVDISGSTGGFYLVWNYATNKLQVFQTGAAVKGKFEELPAGAYPAEITGASVRIMVIGS